MTEEQIIIKRGSGFQYGARLIWVFAVALRVGLLVLPCRAQDVTGQNDTERFKKAFNDGNYIEAATIFGGQGVDRNNVMVQFYVGEMFRQGNGFKTDLVAAVVWYRKAAEQGNADAQGNLSVMYAKGRGIAEDQAEAVKWCRKAAEKGQVTAQYNLGGMYAKGKGVIQDDEESARWCRKAAEQGHAGAQCSLGLMYTTGQGVERDDVKAVKWYRKAAEQGNVNAQFFLGAMYAAGRGVEQDDADAVKWYRKAAEQGDAVAQFSLGVMYKTGRGVVLDDAEAVRWYRKAAAQGLKEAQEALRRRNLDQSPQEVAGTSLFPMPVGGEEEPKVAVSAGMAAVANSHDGGDSLKDFDVAPYSRHTIKPLYPYSARRQGREGSVELEVLISEKGRVMELKVVRSTGTPDMDDSAKQAVMKTIFEPAKLKNNPVPARVVLTIVFRLTN